MPIPEQFTPLRRALARGWLGADEATYDLLFDTFHRAHCNQYPLDKSRWNQLHSEWQQQMQVHGYQSDAEILATIEQKTWLSELKSENNVVPDQKRVMVSSMVGSPPLKTRLDQLPDPFKYWHLWGGPSISSDLLRTIDELWLKRSKGKFGFSVQRDIFLECGGEIVVGQDPRLHITPADLIQFQGRVGWCIKPFSSYPPFFTYQEAPRGHFPMLSLHNPFLSQIEECTKLEVTDLSHQSPICQHYCWWILSHKAFNP